PPTDVSERSLGGSVGSEPFLRALSLVKTGSHRLRFSTERGKNGLMLPQIARGVQIKGSYHPKVGGTGIHDRYADGHTGQATALPGRTLHPPRVAARPRARRRRLVDSRADGRVRP